MMAALALRPHRSAASCVCRFGYLDFVLLLTWWTFFYAFIVLPWMYAHLPRSSTTTTYNVITNMQNMVIVVSLGVLWLRAKRRMARRVREFVRRGTLYLLSSLPSMWPVDSGDTQPGSLYRYTADLFFFVVWAGGRRRLSNSARTGRTDGNSVEHRWR